MLLSFFAEAPERENFHTLQFASELSHKIYQTYIRQNFDRLVAKPDVDLTFTLDSIYDLMGWASMGNIVSDLRPDQGQLENQSLVDRIGFSQILDFYDLMIAMNVLIPIDNGIYQFVHIALRDHFASDYALHMIQDPDVANRLNAVYVFQNTRDTRSIPYLIDCLDDNYARVGGTSAELLGEIGDWRAIDGLIRLTHDGDKVIRKLALDAISKTTDGRATDTLINALSHDNPAVQRALVAALNNIGSAAVESFVAALRHNHGVVRGMSAKVLGDVGDPSAIQPLKALLVDTANVTFTQRVCDLASGSIAKLQ